jgi:hypothetical protein
MRQFILTLLGFAVLLCQPPPRGQADDEPTKLPPGFLAEGPMRVKLRFARVASQPEWEETGDLLLLTKERIFYQSNKNRLERKSIGHTVLEVRVLDRKGLNWIWDLHWVWDKERKELRGPPPVRPADISLTPADCTPRQEEQYLYSGLLRLLRESDNALLTGNALALKVIKERVTRIADHMGRRGLSRKLKENYADVGPYLERAGALLKMREAVIARKLNERERAARQQADASRLQQIRNAAALVKGLVGYVIEDHSMIRESLGSWTLSSLNYELERSRREADARSFEEASKNELDAIWMKFDEDRDRRDKRAEDLAAALGLPRPDQQFARQLEGSRDPLALIKWLEAYAEAVRRATGRPDPWLVADIAELRAARSAGASKRLAEEILPLARQCVAAAAYVPPWTFYNSDRVMILCTAATVAARAAELYHGTMSWRDVYHPTAAYAERLFTFADRYQQGPDLGGWARRHRLVALALSLRSDEALQLGYDLRELNVNSLSYHFRMARLRAGSGEFAKFLEHAKHVAASGAVPELKKCVEVVQLLKYDKYSREFALHTTPRVQAWVTSTVVGRTRQNTLLVENLSSFPLRNVRGVLTSPNGQQRTELTEVLPVLGAREKRAWSSALPSSLRLPAFFHVHCENGDSKRVQLFVR